MNIDDLLAPISEDAPCGENLEYDLTFMQMLQHSRGKAEQQFGETLIPAQEPNWRQVEKCAVELLACSKDLRVMLLLAQAWTAQRGLAGYADGVTLICEALERYWQPLLPPLSLDGESDPLMRINLLRELGDNFELAKLLRRSLFVRDAGQSLTFADAIAALDGAAATADYPGGPARLSVVLQRGLDDHEGHTRVIKNALERIIYLLRTHLGDAALPDMHGILAALYTLSRQQAALPSSGKADLPSDFSEENAHASSSPGYHSGEHASSPPYVSQGEARECPPDAAAPVGQACPPRQREAGIHTRDEAYQSLEKVKRYFMQYESSHPAPLMIARIQRLMSQDFMAIVRNLAPEAAGQLEQFFGCEHHKEQ